MIQDDQMAYYAKQSRERPLSRRDFVRALSVATAAGPGMATLALSGLSLTRSQRAEAAQAAVDGMGKLPKRKLGTRMGNMLVTPVCMSQDWNGELFAPAIAMGINFIHKAGYWGNNVPDEIRKLPRESYYTDITVDNTSPGHDPDNYDEAYNQVVQSLDRNGLKYYDIYRAHYGWRTVDSLTKNTSYKAFQRLKREGKVRYFAVSQHPYHGDDENPVNYPGIIQAEIDSGIIDSMQVWYSYGYPQEIEEVFAKASKAGIAMTAMKINAHGRGKMSKDPEKMQEMKADGMVGRALLRYVLSNTRRPDNKPVFSTCVSALGNMQQFEENVGAFSSKVALRDGFDASFGSYA